MGKVITKIDVDSQGYDQKIKAAQRSLDQFGMKGTEVGQKMSGLGRVLTGNLKTIGPWGAALAAAGGAMKVIGDAFRSSETNMDAWHATMEGAQSAYQSFLTALNTSDFSSFFTNIREVIAAARDAYNSLDELGTYNAFAARGNAKNKAAYSEAVANFKENKSDENREAVRVASEAVIADLEQQRELTSKAYKDAVKKLALEQGMTGSNVDEFVDMFANKSWSDLTAAKAGYAKGKGANMATYWNGYQVQGNDLLTRDASGVVTERRAMTEDEQAAFKFARALNEVSDEAIQSTQALGAQEEQINQAIADQRRNAARMLGEAAAPKAQASTAAAKPEKSAPAEGSIDYQTQLVANLRKEWTAAASDEARATIKTQLDEATAALDALLGKTQEVEVTMEPAFQSGSLADLQSQLAEATAEMNNLTIGTDEWRAALERVNAAQEAVTDAQNKIKPGKVEKAGEGAVDASHNFQMAASAVNSLSGAMAQMEDPAAKIAGLIGQAIASIALTFASSLKGTATPWDWIAAAAAGTATMIGTIAAIKQATEYHANGGFAGDMFAPRGTDTVPAMLTPGELVLNRAQQTNLASQLQPATPQVNITGRLSGRDILLAADNTNRSRGGSRGVYSRVR